MDEEITKENPQKAESISGKMVQGTTWMVSMRWVLQLIGVVNTVIIARLLAPDDFGVIAMAMIIVGFLTEVSETNVAIALIRNKDATREDYDTAWTIKILMGGLLTVTLIALAPIVADYYGDPRVEIVIQIISFRCLINGFENIGVVDFRKNMEFAKEFRYWIYRRLTDIVISLTIIYVMRNYHALAMSMLVAGSVTVFYSFAMSSYRPWFCLKKIRSLWSVSQWLMIDHGSKFIGRRVDEFIIGATVGSSTVGAYYMASEISSTPTRQVVIPADRALLPAFAKVADNPDESRLAFLRVFGFVALYSLPAGIGISVVSADLVPLLLGPKWDAAIPFFEWLGIYAAFEAIWMGVRPYFLAHKGERAYSLLSVGYAFVLVPAIILAGHLSGVIAIAMTRTGLMFLMAILTLIIVDRLRYARLNDMLSVLWRPFFASVVMWLGIKALPEIDVGWHIVPLLCDVTVGAAIYIGLDMFLWLLSGRPDGPEAVIVNLVKTKLSRSTA